MKETIEKLVETIKNLNARLDGDKEDGKGGKRKRAETVQNDASNISSIPNKDSTSVGSLSGIGSLEKSAHVAGAIFGNLSRHDPRMSVTKPSFSDFVKNAGTPWSLSGPKGPIKMSDHKNKSNFIVEVNRIKDADKVPKKAEKTFHYYTSGWDIGTTEDEIKEYIRNIVNDVEVEVERKVLQHERFAGYRFSLNEKHNDKIVNPLSWISGIRVKRYFFGAKEREEQKKVKAIKNMTPATTSKAGEPVAVNRSGDVVDTQSSSTDDSANQHMEQT